MGQDIGKLVLRLALGLMIILHGIAKLSSGPGFIVGMLEAHHLPAQLAYGVYVGEIIAPLMIIAGFYTRAGAAIIAFNMLVAIYLVHMGQLLKLGEHGGWAIELQGFYLFTALAVACLGAGRFALKN